MKTFLSYLLAISLISGVFVASFFAIKKYSPKTYNKIVYLYEETKDFFTSTEENNASDSSSNSMSNSSASSTSSVSSTNSTINPSTYPNIISSGTSSNSDVITGY